MGEATAMNSRIQGTSPMRISMFARSSSRLRGAFRLGRGGMPAAVRDADLIHRFVDSGRHTTQTFREQPGRRQGR
jgi:hypothetical protein